MLTTLLTHPAFYIVGAMVICFIAGWLIRRLMRRQQFLRDWNEAERIAERTLRQRRHVVVLCGNCGRLAQHYLVLSYRDGERTLCNVCAYTRGIIDHRGRVDDVYTYQVIRRE
jgi:hypothetical protein